MRLLVLLCLATSVTAADPQREIEPHAISTLTGCWQMRGERWTFRKSGEHGLEVIRTVDDSSYAERARIPHDVLFDAKTGDFGFGAAGRIHAAMFIFRLGNASLDAWSYWKPDGTKSYAWSGNRFTLVPCH